MEFCEKVKKQTDRYEKSSWVQEVYIIELTKN